jgi:RNA polymerase sigma-70 factor (ECF subfamily)
MSEEVRSSAVGAVATAAVRGPAIAPGLVARYVAGDRDAFRELFEALRQQIFGVVSRYFRSPFDQEEAVQEAWLQIYRARRAFDVSRHEAFAAWARQVARNRCLDLLKARDRNREVPVAEELLDATEGAAPAAVDPLAQVAEERLRQAIASFVAGLDAEERQFFELCFVQEQAHEQLAARLGINVRRAKYLKQKLLARLLRHEPLRVAWRA